jgi:hypothetical protein
MAAAVALVSLALGTIAVAADKTAAAPRVAVAHSAQLQLDSQESGDTLVLRLRRASDQKPLDSNDVTVAVDGKSQLVTHLADGSYSLQADEWRGKGEKALEMVVGHDGIREVLNGKLPALEARSATSLVTDHKQLAWWILNIAVVLAGAIALSRRKSF